MSTVRKKIDPISTLGIFAALFFFILVPSAFAADFSATPAVIDGKGKQREILRYSITLQNKTSRIVSVYPWVSDLDTKEGVIGSSDLEGSRDMALAASLAKWIEVTRGVIDLLPDEKRDIPVLVQINQNAKPGVYHAIIHLSTGGSRVEAEANKKGTIDIMLNIEVLEDANVRLQLGNFIPKKNIFAGEEAEFEYRVENIGNRGVIPTGNIRIYDRRGEEVASIAANGNGARLEPDQKQLLASTWAAAGSFGRYKAFLDITYGDRGTLQDTVYFWILPWTKLLGIFFALSFLGVALGTLFYSRNTARRRLALATASFEPANSRSTENVLPLKEVDIPPPSRTRYSVARTSTSLSGTTNEVPETHRVRLEKKGRKVDPSHIVSLRK